MPKASTSKTSAGKELRKLFLSRSLTQSQAANLLGTSQGYVSDMVTGSRPLTLGWAGIITTAVEANQEEKKRLLVSIAKDAGFDIDLT